MSNRGWIGVDLDGTLAKYDGWRGSDHIGEPIEPMLKRVQEWLEQGLTVKIFTARAYCPPEPQNPGKLPAGNYNPDNLKIMEAEYTDWLSRRLQVRASLRAIQAWCGVHLGTILDVTCTKDFNMVELWDDRCVQVMTNTGERVG
jgi:hypothetical protein